ATEDDVVGAGFEEHEMGIFLRHLGHEFEPENVSVEGAAAGQVADRNRHVQDAFGLDHANLPRSDSGCRRVQSSIDSLEKISVTINPAHRRAQYLPKGSTI